MAPSSSRAFSPPLSTVSSIGSVLAQRPVTKLAIEGRCRQDSDGANLRIFLKMSIPVENLSPGAAIPLFPEENVRIITSRVHPLDSNSAPYAFSTTGAPLLHRTARALNLPPRSSKSYFSVVGVPPPPPSPTNSNRKPSAQPLTVSLTGEINVSNFHICFILPKVFPPRLSDSEANGYVSGSSRRNSFVERHALLFMAGVEVFVPFLAKPPRSPFVLSLPLPRCLHNTIKLRVPPPPRTSTADDPPPWDFMSEPFVSNSRNRSNSYALLEDDEESFSDSQASSSSAGFSASGVQGTFPSSDSIRIRWAAPMSRHHGLGVLADGRRRVGVEDVVGLTKCTVLEQDATGMKVRVQYEGRCRGVWFPGVATLLGLDVVLDPKGRDITWPSAEDKWEVTGGKGFTGFDAGSKPPASQSSRSSPGRTSPPKPYTRQAIPIVRSSLNTPSLLRTPIPNLNPSDYSFETSNPSSTPSTMPSDMSSNGLATTSGIGSPTHPVMIHVNMTDLDAPPQNEFMLKITGTIFISSASSPNATQRQQDEDTILSLPVFRVLGAEKQRVEVLVSSETADGLQLVLPDQPGGKGPPRHRLLRKRSEVKAEEGVGVLFSPSPSPRSTTSSVLATPEIKVLPPNGSVPRRVHSSRKPVSIMTLPLIGPSVLPLVNVIVTPLPQSSKHSHAVQLLLSLPFPSSSADMSHEPTNSPFQFGVLLPPSFIGAAKLQGKFPDVTLVSSTVGGVAVRAEVYPRVPESGVESPLHGGFEVGESDEAGSTVGPEQLSREFVCWIQVHLEDSEGGLEGQHVGMPLEVVYLVGKPQIEEGDARTRSKKKDPCKIDAFLPCFMLDVGRLCVIVENPIGYESPDLVSTNLHRHQPFKLSNYSLPPYFTPRLSFTLFAKPKTGPRSSGAQERQALRAAARALSQLLPVVLLYFIWSLSAEVRELRAVTDDIAVVSGVGPWYVNEGGRWPSGSGDAGRETRTTTIVSETLTLTFPGQTTLSAPPTTTSTATVIIPNASLSLHRPLHPFLKIADINALLPSELAGPLNSLANLFAAADFGSVASATVLALSRVLRVLRWLLNYPLAP